MAGRGKGLHHHGPLHERQVTRGGCRFHRKSFLKVTSLDFQIFNTAIHQESIFEFQNAVCKIKVYFSVPVFCYLGFDGKSCPAYGNAVAYRIVIRVFTKECGPVYLNPAVKPDFVVFIPGFKYQDTVALFGK
ncbi:MAG: hypothetical protein BWX93_01627 [Bacteroidetes bacterium ADurb.Bin139]|nr:MAG: hypothetical protein BWX93_01627 [Bacteroidetes bacterium ADurb.Bin139]